jgi:hypothetical protein
MIKPTSDRAAVVNTEYHWTDAKEYPPPLGPKLLCINKQQGVAVLSHWVSAFGFTHWAGLPSWRKEDEL